MNKESLYMVIIIALLTCTLYFGYDKYFVKKESSLNNCSSEVVNNKSDNILDKFVGKYVSSEYDEEKLDELDRYYTLEINEDGTTFYNKVFKSGDGEIGKGKIAISNDTIYLVNETCKEPVILDDECVYPNCQPIYEFKYTDDKITNVDNNVELFKQ